MTTSKIPAGVIDPVKAKCAEIVAAFPEITHVYGYAAAPSDHKNRKCVDFMVYNDEKPASQNLSRVEQVALGDAIAAYLWANRGRLGLVLVIWNKRILRTYDKRQGGRLYRAGTWAPYNASINPFWTNPHTDHAHAEFGGSRYVPPNGGQRSTVGTVWLDRLVPGVTDSDSVRLVQRALGIPRTGAYDSVTIDAVRNRQIAWGDDPKYCDGILGPKQTALLFADAGMQVEIRTDPSGRPPTSQPTPAPEEPKPARAQISVVDANVLRRTDLEAGKSRLTWANRLPGIITAIKSGRPDLVLCQELDRSTAANIADGLGTGWAYDRKNGIGIFWRQAVLERTADAVYHLYSDRDNRYVLSLPLRHKPSGITFTADVTHLENNGDPATNAHRARRLQATEMAARTRTGRRVSGADFNSTTRAVASPTPRQKEKPRVILAGVGWSFLTDHAGTTNGVLESHWGGRVGDRITSGPWIDDIGVRGGVAIVEARLIRTDSTRCSDHHFLQATIRL